MTSQVNWENTWRKLSTGEFKWAPQVICPGLCPENGLQDDNKLRVFLKKNREQGSMTYRIHKLDRWHGEDEIQRVQLQCMELKDKKLTLQV